MDFVNEWGSFVELFMGGVKYFLLKGMWGVIEESLLDGEFVIYVLMWNVEILVDFIYFFIFF